MKNQVKEVEKIVSVLTKDEQQLLKDTINRGFGVMEIKNF